MRNRQTLNSGLHNSVTLSSTNPTHRRGGGTPTTANYMPGAPPRRTFLGGFVLSQEGEVLPSFADGRRYLLSWTFGGAVVATLLGLLWVWMGGAMELSLQHFPWLLWWMVVLFGVGFATWNVWYLKQLAVLHQRDREMALQEKRAREAPRERLFSQIIASASNASPELTAARVNAILRLPDFILLRSSDSGFFRTVGSGLISAILMECNAIEREGGLDRNSRMVKNAAVQAMLAIKEHLNGVSLQEVNLSGFDLSFANLFGADLASTRLIETNLEEANLQSARLDLADLQKANLQSAVLQGSHLTDAVLIGANLASARLRGAHAQRANFQQAILRGADLSEADLRGANLESVNLQGANLRFADLRGANLRGANVTRADLEGADLEGADLAGADMQGTRTQGANLPH